MNVFRLDVWERELGSGGLIGDLVSVDRSPIGLIASGELRRFVPVWANKKYLPPLSGTIVRLASPFRKDGS